jgi:molybdopterin-containing oxidoreductase family iron-sulfur binding subunit
MSRHYQFESALSLTGANADYRTPIKPSQEGLVVASLYNKVARATGGTTIGVTELKLPYLDQAAKDLVNAKGKSLVVSGSNDVNVQILVNALNHLLGNYGTTLTIDRPSYLKQGDDAAMANFVKEVNDGAIQAVIFYNANPVYDYPTGSALADSLKKVGLKISFADRINETAAVVDYVCPDHNYLESWGDAEPIQGFFSVVQPTINPIFKTRHAQESLLTWAGINTDQYTYVKNYWRKNLFPQQTAFSSFESFWTQTLHDGVFEPGKGTAVAPSGTAFTGDLNAAFANISRLYKPESNTIELSLYEKVSIGNGDGANNPYLQEFPDPISRACWDNYLAVSKKMAGDMGLEQGDVVKIDAQGKPSVSVPVLIQPGQADGSVSLAVGYGREKAGKAANKVGKNAFTFASFNGTTISYVVPDVKITKTGEKRELAQVQTHHTIMARPVVQEAKLTAYQANPAAGRYKPKINTEQGPKKPGEITMWDEHSKTNHSWGMVIDLNSCTGCGACVVACNVENNIPVVGRQEVINRREMHWLRIDRYYSSDGTPENKNWTEYHKLEEASANPEVVFQPMLCQHCSNAPCETVCPVLATTHSFEGLNQMTYNRCIGTRYCANNCPYKVRRFNWFKYHDNEKFDYHMNNDLGKMVLNPDVTVRARGVMEKCSFCVQRIQEGKLNAKKERRRPKDGEIVTACAQSCATGAIVFGDMNDPESKVSQLIAEEHDKRAFQVLEEINVKPQISYLTKIRNKA